MSIIQEIKTRIKPSQIISAKVALKSKNSGEFIAICPFHSEKTPSFTVSDNKGFYHCFGCGAHGDIFTFIMESEGYNYREALNKLAKEAGVVITGHQNTSRFDIIYKIYAAANSFFRSNLREQEGVQALKYLEDRSLSQNIIERYGLGYAPYSNTGLISYLKKEFEIRDIKRANIFSIREDIMNNPFKGRIIFPITNENNQVVAFGGRALGQESKPKYLNSADNPIFHKNKILYGLHLAKSTAFKERRIIIVEGYIDVIALASHGIQNVVAPLGTGINVEQIKHLWDMRMEPIMCLDADSAGHSAAVRLARNIFPYLEPDKSLRFCRLVGGKDPDEVINNKGVEFFHKTLDSSIPISQYIIEEESNIRELETPEQKSELQEALLKLADSIEHRNLKYIYRRHFIDHFNKQRFQLKNKSSDKKSITELEVVQPGMVIFHWIKEYPEVLQNEEIYEEFNRTELPELLDKLRNTILSIDNQDVEIIADCIRNTDIIGQAEVVPDLSTDQAINYIKRVFKLNLLDCITQEIQDAIKMLAGHTDEKAYKRLIALKHQEEQLKHELNII